MKASPIHEDGKKRLIYMCVVVPIDENIHPPPAQNARQDIAI